MKYFYCREIIILALKVVHNLKFSNIIFHQSLPWAGQGVQNFTLTPTHNLFTPSLLKNIYYSMRSDLSILFIFNEF